MSRGQPVIPSSSINYEPHTEHTEQAAGERLQNEEAEEDARVAAQEEYGFGLASSEPGQGSLSNEELMAWVARHNDKLNGSLRDLMASADDRIQLAEDFTKVKGLIGAHLSMGAAKAAAEAMMEQYEGTPYEHEVNKVLETVVADLDSRMEGKYSDDPVPDDLVTKLTGEIQGQVDSIQKQDQLDMIAIQDLTSQIRENTQLVSNMISSINQTAMSIIGNVGRA